MTRLPALDSLRGLAALAVVICHYFVLLSNVPLGRQVVSWLWIPPLSLFATAMGAVTLFFVLSGYVLALGLLGDRNPSWACFAARRLCRIWLPFAAVILFSVAIGSSVRAVQPFAPPAWEGNTWHDGSITIRAVIDQVSMASCDISLDVVAWSLVHELRISLVFPLLLACVRSAPATTITVFLCLHLAGRAGPPWLSQLVPDTASYVVYFTAGAWLALNQARVAVIAGRIGGVGKFALGEIGVLLLSVPAGIPGAGLATGVGAFLLLALVTSSPAAARILSASWCQHLGRVSYSLYLTHVIVLMGLGRLLGWWLPVPAVLVIAAPAIAIVAWAGFYWIERPSIRLGRTVAARFAR